MLACVASLPGAGAIETVEVAEGVHMVIGSTGEAAPANRGEVGNAGFVVGPTGTVMINSGGSFRHGRALVEVAENIGGKPVVLLIVTQPLQEFVMGAAAFTERGIPMLSHSASARLVESRCEICLDNLTQLLGEAEMHRTRVMVPTWQVERSQTLEIGGRMLELIHPGWASSPGDLMVRDRVSGVIFTGSLVSIGRVPELRDGNVPGWLEALEDLEERTPGIIVPGYGGPVEIDESGWTPISELKAYIAETDRTVRALFEAGTPLSAAAAHAELPAYAHWALYSTLHGRNVQHLYLQLERELLDQPPFSRSDLSASRPD